MNELMAEFLGTFLLILLGNGVVANVVLKDTKGHQAGWVAISAGWGLAVFIAVFVVSPYSGAHINPAVTLGFALTGQFGWGKVLPYMLAQLAGGFAGGMVVYLFYRHHFGQTNDAISIRACFCTSPAIRKIPNNFLSEVIGTFVLMLAILYITGPAFVADGIDNATIGLGAIDALPVGLVVFAIGLSLGGTTGYAINPARDLGPRLAHALLPMANKGSNDWKYAGVPVIGPLAGAVLAAGVYTLIGH